MLTKDLLRVSRTSGRYQPRFIGADREDLAAQVLGVYQGHVGEPRERLEESLTDLEVESEDFKLVRGFAKLLEREATFETRAAVDPERARRTAFEAGEAVGVVTAADRATALDRAAARLSADAAAVADALYADRESRQVLTAFDPRWDPAALVDQYNLSLAQTALFDAVEVCVRSSDPRAFVSAVKRFRLMYEIRKTDSEREVVVTGPTALFQRSRRYGTRFARLLRTVATAQDWHLEATVDDRGTERELVLDGSEVTVPGTAPVAEPSYDSGVEADFAARFRALGLDWELRREPEPLETGTRVMIPDFAFDWPYADFRVYFEVMGFWTPEYVEKKLDQLDHLEDVELLVAVDESLGVGEEIEARDARAIPYEKTVRVKDVRDALRPYEDDLVAANATDLDEALVPDDDVIPLVDLAGDYGVSEAALEDKNFPEHRRVGRTLVRPRVLDDLATKLDAGMRLADAETVLAERGLGDTSAVLSALGYRVAWEGLEGGVLQEKERA